MTLFLGDGAKTPLMDASMSAAVRRRMNEMWGIGFALLALAFGAALWSYNVSDPSLFSATGMPASNLLGSGGAVIADTMIRYLGLGAWGVPMFFAVWAVRFLLHLGEERIWARLLLVLPSMVLLPVFASTHAIYDSWPLSGAGLGGTFGDSGARALLDAIPMPDGGALPVLSLLTGSLLVLVGGAALGFTFGEVARLWKWLSGSLRRASSSVVVAGASLGGRAYARAKTQIEERNRKPRSETLEPAEPTGSWRSKMPAMPAMPNVSGLKVPSISMPKMPSLSGLRSKGEDRREPELRLDVSGLDVDNPNGAESPEAEPDMSAAGAATDGDKSTLRTVFSRLSEAGDYTDPGPADDMALSALDQSAPEATAESAVAAADEIPVMRPPIERGKDTARKSRQAEAERQPALALDPMEGAEVYEQPALGLLAKPVAITRAHTSDIALEENARMLETVLEDYGVRGEIVAVRPGPVVTLYELEPAPGLKASRVIGLADDIARSMSALAARVSTVPGRSIIGIELPNSEREKVWLRDVFERREYGDAKYPLALALGKEISGVPVISNLAKMPHLLIAGTTGSGKSVAINTMILSLLYRLSPDQCRLIMIDPKMLELSVYDNIPHLLAPVVTDPKKAIVALKWVVAEMEERYRKMSKMGVRNIDGYNARVRDALEKGEYIQYHKCNVEGGMLRYTAGLLQ
ncbi:MAG: DNA translocase FtsK 4TM domain-containing protein [Pseudomonadota bacterium]